jgi:hypothetical protein
MRTAIFLVLAAVAAGQGTDPKRKAEDYPAHAAAGAVTVGAEYLIHSFSGQGEMFVARDYLVVEVALFPQPDERLEVNSGHFTLRINGRKRELQPQAPGMVAASLKYADWETRPSLQAGAGMGDGGVVLGGPQATERFPGDPRAQQRLPRPPQAPEQEDPSGLEKRVPVKPDELAVSAALPEGPARGPVSGFLYFAWKGKPGAIKSLELSYRGAVLKLI